MGHPFFFQPQFSPAGPPQSFNVHAPVRPPVPHRPWPPHRPPPISPSNGGGPGPASPAYRSSSPPPAYTPRSTGVNKPLLDLESQRLSSQRGEEAEEGSGQSGGNDSVSDVIIAILVVLNAVVWGMVLWGYIHDAQVPRLWSEVQQSDRVVFDV